MNICKICNRLRTKKWFVENIDKYREGSRRRYKNNPEVKVRSQKWREENKELMRSYRKKWAESNMEKQRENVKNYSAKNLDKIRIKSARWRANNPEKLKFFEAKARIRNSYKINAKNSMRRANKIMATPSWLTSMQKAQMQWFYFAAKMMSDTSGVSHHVDHIHPLQGNNFTGLHAPWNLRVIKASENISKGNHMPPEEAHLTWDAT